MSNPLLKYLESQRWVNGVEKSRADSQLEYINAVSADAERANDRTLGAAMVRLESLPDRKQAGRQRGSQGQ